MVEVIRVKVEAKRGVPPGCTLLASRISGGYIVDEPFFEGQFFSDDECETVSISEDAAAATHAVNLAAAAAAVLERIQDLSTQEGVLALAALCFERAARHLERRASLSAGPAEEALLRVQAAQIRLMQQELPSVDQKISAPGA